MASEDRAAHALGRTYPGGIAALVAAMNEKARALGLNETKFVDPTGLSDRNLSSAKDLIRLVEEVPGLITDINALAPGALCHFEFDAIAFVQRLEAAALNRGGMNKNVTRTTAPEMRITLD